MNTKKNIDSQMLTSGSIYKQLIIFMLPFLGSSLIQQLYNTVDLMFVGKILDKDASAAVGASGLLVTCLIGFFTGMSIGVSVIAGRYFGRGEQKELHKVIHTAAGMTLLGAVILIIIGWTFSPAFLRWMNTPDDIIETALVYIRIYFTATLSIISYNISAGIINALGNSKSPMIYQLIGGIINIIGNFLFIYILNMGVKGAALATLLSQSAAAFLAIRHLCLLPEEYRFKFNKICLNSVICKKILSVGIPAAIQSIVITLSNIFVQSQINILGVDSIAAFTAYFKVENFIYLPIMAFGQANTTFVSQNIGAGKIDRAKKGTRTAIIFGIGITVIVSSLILILSEQAFGLFTSDYGIVKLGSKLALTTFPFYFLYVFLEVLSGAVRGAGKALPPMLIIVINMCFIRIAILKIMMYISSDAVGIAKVYPLTWLITALCIIIYYFTNSKY